MQKIVCPQCHGVSANYDPSSGSIACPKCGTFTAFDFFKNKIGLFLRDLESAEVLPCGCWVNKRTWERFYYCPTHLEDDEV